MSFYKWGVPIGGTFAAVGCWPIGQHQPSLVLSGMVIGWLYHAGVVNWQNDRKFKP
jgi:hypothetical protein